MEQRGNASPAEIRLWRAYRGATIGQTPGQIGMQDHRTSARLAQHLHITAVIDEADVTTAGCRQRRDPDQRQRRAMRLSLRRRSHLGQGEWPGTLEKAIVTGRSVPCHATHPISVSPPGPVRPGWPPPGAAAGLAAAAGAHHRLAAWPARTSQALHLPAAAPPLARTCSTASPPAP